MKLIATFFCFVLLLSGCDIFHVYRSHNEQGNLIDSVKVKQLSVGMTKADVVNLMGSPLLNNVFDENRWEYIHIQGEGRHEPEIERVIILFSNDRVQAIETS